MSASILFVCLGNICRSPMAEGIARSALLAAGRTDVLVDSAGTAAHHAGEAPDPRSAAVLRREGQWHPMRARQVEASDFDRFTWILAMDDANLRDLRARAPAGCRATIHKVRAPVGGGDVPDPYYGGADGFDRVHGLLTEAIAAWISRLPPP